VTIHHVEQGSPEWHALRVGKVTGSRVTDICAKLKSGGWGASRTNYLAELVLERLTGRHVEGFLSQGASRTRGRNMNCGFAATSSRSDSRIIPPFP
jgi:hypothetical protein